MKGMPIYPLETNNDTEIEKAENNLTLSVQYGLYERRF